MVIDDPTFPARDETFARRIAGLSAEESGPHADNLMTNEDAFPRVAGEVGRLVPKGNVYLGVGPDQNLTYIAHCEPALAFVLDYRRRNLRLHLLHKALASLSEDRAAYLTRLTARRPPKNLSDPSADDLVAAFTASPFDRTFLNGTAGDVARLLRPFGMLRDDEWADLETIGAKLAGPGMDARFLALKMYPTLGQLIRTPDRDGRPAHFLADEALYRRVRDAHREDRIMPIVGDFAAGPTLPKLGDWLGRRGLNVGLLYISDVEFFLLRRGTFPAYIESLRRLPWHPKARIIRTSTREIDHPERVPGDSATTILRSVAPFLATADAVRNVDDLFR